MDTGTVFDGGDRIQCADPVLSAQEDPMLVERDGREPSQGQEESSGILPVGMYGAGGNHRNREYHGGGGGCDRRRTRCGVLDVGVRLPRNGDGLRGDSSRDPVPGKRTGRRMDGGTDDVSRKAAGMSQGGGPLRIFLYSGGFRHGKHGAGKRDLGDGVLCLRDSGGSRGGDPCGSCGDRAGRGRPADLPRGGAACPLIGRALHGGITCGDLFTCGACTGSAYGDHGGRVFLSERGRGCRGIWDLTVRELWDRQGRVLQRGGAGESRSVERKRGERG